MVSFQELHDVMQSNPHKGIRLEAIRLTSPPPISSFTIPPIVVESVKIPVKPKVPIHQQVDSSDSEDSIPPPTRSVGPAALTPPNTAPPTVRLVPPVASVVGSTTTIIPPPTTKFSKPDFPRGSMDPICIGVEHHDPMYAIATPPVRISLECAEAQRLESMVDVLYKEQAGRSRGWTKTKLSEFLVPRAAAGSRLHAKSAFDWGAIWTQKEASALLDFVCLAKGIRLAVWKSPQEVGLWPAADKEGTAPPLLHVGSSGAPLQNREITRDTRILAPYSVVAGLEKLSLDELESVAEKMGVSLPSCKKTEKAAFLASARMRMRLGL